jgi:ribosomal protein S12 methylthiotransferase accessory factor
VKSKIVLQDAPKGYTLDLDKVMAPSETVRRFKEKLQRINLDILKSTIRIDNGRLDIPVYFSTCGADALDTIGTKKQMGKGATPDQAEASAVMELAERFSFFSFAKNPANFKVDYYPRLGEAAMSFDDIARSVHDSSEDLPVAREIFGQLPFKWTWGFNLTAGTECLIPFDWFYAINEFNGPSAGNCQEEAILQGICELVERHTSSLVSQGRLSVPAIRSSSVGDAIVKEMITKYESNGIRLFISDFTLDMGIPTVAVLAYDPKTFPELSEIVWTAGTTPDPNKALSRALTETAQLAGDFNSGSNYVASGLPKFTRLEDAGFIMAPGSETDLDQLPDLSNDNIRVEVERCLAVLAEHQMDVFLIDTRHADLDIPAFYTIIPGAHFRERSQGTSVAMFCAKHVYQNLPPHEALPALSRIEEMLPDRYYVHFYQGNCLLDVGNPDRALAHFSRALKLNPTGEDRASILSYMGIAYRDKGEYRKALEVLQEGVRQDGERTDLYNLMGFCLFKLNRYEAAIEQFQKVIQLDPSSAIDYANIASNYRRMGKTDQAIQYYRMALTLDPSIEFARQHLSELTGGQPANE